MDLRLKQLETPTRCFQRAHRPEQASARGSASSDPRGALITAQDRDYTQAEPRGKFSCVITHHATPFRPRRAQETVTLPQTVPRDADDRE